MSKRNWFILTGAMLVGLFLAGCATGSSFSHPQFGAASTSDPWANEEFGKVWYECKAENTHSYAGIPSVNYEVMEECLRAKGWRKSP